MLLTKWIMCVCLCVDYATTGPIEQVIMSVQCRLWAFSSIEIIDCCITYTQAFVFLAQREVVCPFDD